MDDGRGEESALAAVCEAGGVEGGGEVEGEVVPVGVAGEWGGGGVGLAVHWDR